MIDEYGEFGGMWIGRENLSTRRKPAPVLLCPPQITHDNLGSNPSRRGGKPAMARHFHIYKSTSLHTSLLLTGLLSACPGKWWNSKNLEVVFPLCLCRPTMPWICVSGVKVKLLTSSFRKESGLLHIPAALSLQPLKRRLVYHRASLTVVTRKQSCKAKLFLWLTN
jgi:hypothetical protein